MSSGLCCLECTHGNCLDFISYFIFLLGEYGPESTPAEFLEDNAPQVLIGTDDKEVVVGESPAGVTIQEPSRDLSRKKS